MMEMIWFFIRSMICFLPLINQLPLCQDNARTGEVKEEFIQATLRAGKETFCLGGGGGGGGDGYGNETSSTGWVRLDTNGGPALEASGCSTVRKAGLILLSNAREMISSVACQNNNAGSSAHSLNIIFKESIVIHEDMLEFMFPEDSLLILNEEVFGPCFAESSRSNLDEAFAYFYNLTSGSDDGYLIIRSAALSADNSVAISVDPSFFFSIFQDASISFQAIDEDERFLDESFTTLEFGVENFKLAPFVSASAIGKLSNKSRMRRLDMDFGYWGFDFRFELELGYSFMGDVNTFLQAGITSALTVPPLTLLSTMIGPPPLKLVEILKKMKFIKSLDELPDLKIGFYHEIKLILELSKAVVNREFGPYFDYDYNSGTKHLEIRLWFDIRRSEKFGISHTILDDSLPSSTMNAGLRGLDDERTTIDVTAFFGLRNQLFFYVTKYAGAGIAIDCGVEIATNTAVDRPHDPTMPDPYIGLCQFPHFFEGDISIVLRSPVVKGMLKVPPELLNGLPLPSWSPILAPLAVYSVSLSMIPGDPKVTEKLLTVCAWEQKVIKCSDLWTSEQKYKEVSRGLDLRNYTDGTLEWIGTTCIPHNTCYDLPNRDCCLDGQECCLHCECAFNNTRLADYLFSCKDDDVSMTFGSDSDLGISSIVDPGNTTHNIYEPDYCILPPGQDEEISVLCRALGYDSGHVLRARPIANPEYCQSAYAIDGNAQNWAGRPGTTSGLKFRCELES